MVDSAYQRTLDLVEAKKEQVCIPSKHTAVKPLLRTRTVFRRKGSSFSRPGKCPQHSGDLLENTCVLRVCMCGGAPCLWNVFCLSPAEVSVIFAVLSRGPTVREHEHRPVLLYAYAHTPLTERLMRVRTLASWLFRAISLSVAGGVGSSAPFISSAFCVLGPEILALGRSEL